MSKKKDPRMVEELKAVTEKSKEKARLIQNQLQLYYNYYLFEGGLEQDEAERSARKEVARRLIENDRYLLSKCAEIHARYNYKETN